MQCSLTSKDVKNIITDIKSILAQLRSRTETFDELFMWKRLLHHEKHTLCRAALYVAEKHYATMSCMELAVKINTIICTTILQFLLTRMEHIYANLSKQLFLGGRLSTGQTCATGSAC